MPSNRPGSSLLSCPPGGVITQLHADDLPGYTSITVVDGYRNPIGLVIWANRVTGEVLRLCPGMPPLTEHFPAPLSFISRSGASITTWRDLWVAANTGRGLSNDQNQHVAGQQRSRLAFLEAARRSGLSADQWHSLLDAAAHHPDRSKSAAGVLEPV